MASDRIFGLVSLFVALAYIASATQIQTSFLADPVGPKAFPMLVGAVAALSSLVLILRPDPDPSWPIGRTWVSLLIAVVVLIAYAYSLKPLGFLVPTAIAAGVLSYQLSPQPRAAALTGVGLSVGLFVLFRFALGLSLFAFPKGWF
ncbi:putative tricarboxylic transport membrane protein [Monaibacterium marinum]|uniref:Putative tricarboxylic transport membrane protein n=1 Tax=Pontivivens marinum TaxID=1690039 RepID=A0A2C9CV57_9RHOB|nr:tripartite tricarboxylate transporter TctB family protein [Monaibacterium marinum]SOH95152.1 putative tricarboxylic transport membrane protein [Monaibacterium marinum]